MALCRLVITSHNGHGHDPDEADQSREEDDENEFLCHVMPPFLLRPEVLFHVQ
jgi:hypothetical protein